MLCVEGSLVLSVWSTSHFSLTHPKGHWKSSWTKNATKTKTVFFQYGYILYYVLPMFFHPLSSFSLQTVWWITLFSSVFGACLWSLSLQTHCHCFWVTSVSWILSCLSWLIYILGNSCVFSVVTDNHSHPPSWCSSRKFIHSCIPTGPPISITYN